MHRNHELLNGIWREVSRHVDIDEAITQVGVLLKPVMPPHAMAIFRYHAEPGTLETSASFTTHAELGTAPAPLALTAVERKELMVWGRDARVVSDAMGEDPARACLASILLRIGMPPEAAWLAGPLTEKRRFTGCMVVFTRPPNRFESGHTAALQALLDPFSVALKNDSRLRELELLRNAAEAEKIAALRRLGRDRVANNIIGFDGGLQSVIARVGMIARTRMPVLILGETGTGKEVIARVIHERSDRAGGPFLRVNSGAIPSELLDTELFGHEKGSFTGATAVRRGWFERADGGTLLLDEIGELSQAAQIRLLRVLQEGSIDRVGGEKTFHVDVRVVAATHRDLPAMVQQGKFREDLWYRISGFPIVLPPLRERRQDIPALARHFSERAAKIFGLMPQFPTDDDLALLSDYSWPGNIRELAAVIDRAAILGEGRALEIRRALGAAPAGSVTAGSQPTAAAHRRASRPASETLDTLAAAMRKHIEAALTVADGQIEGQHGVAALLDVNPHTLRAKMRKLGIDWAAFRRGGAKTDRPRSHPPTPHAAPW